MLGGDGVDDLAVGEYVAVPMEMAGEVDRGFHAARAHDESQPGLVEGGQVARGEHAGVGGDHDRDLAEVVAVGEGGDDRHQGFGFGGVALEAADLQGEPGAVDQQADHDLWIDAAFFGEADFAQVVFVLGLKYNVVTS